MYSEKTPAGGEVCVAGFVRRPDTHDPNELDALYTIGRLIREDRLHAFSYRELQIESWRRRADEMAFNALAGCSIQHCNAAVERSRFTKTTKFQEYWAKGGKRDVRSGKDISVSQLRFVEWLLSLTDDLVEELIRWRETLGLTEFEIESLRTLGFFRSMCDAANKEDFPDMLHLWTAQRNRMDVFLTLDKGPARIAARFPATKASSAGFVPAILHPRQLLLRLGIENSDPVPIRFGYFYADTGQVIRLNSMPRDVKPNRA